MPRNVEIKARIADQEALRVSIEALEPTGPEVLVQTDTFFNVPRGRLKLREFGDGTGELIGYHRPHLTGPKLSTYTRTSVPDPRSMRDVLARALGVRTIVKKRRRVFLVGQTRIHVDEVEGLGSFIELEVVLNENQLVEEGERIARDLMTRLGIADADLLPVAYADLMEKGRG